MDGPRGRDFFWFATVWTGAGYKLARVNVVDLRADRTVGRHRAAVGGQGWFDHQWGNFATNSASWHWNWFACQLSNGRDLMLYQFITPTGQPTGAQNGTYVPSHGPAVHLRNFTVTPLSPVIRPAGATAAYPLRWRLKVPRPSCTSA